jgi:hypothetical protein
MFMRNLIKKFQNISHQYDLWKKGDGIVVACSGGPDSACLLDIFAKLAPKYNLKLIVAHVNYRLRGRVVDTCLRFLVFLLLLFYFPKKDDKKDNNSSFSREASIPFVIAP